MSQIQQNDHILIVGAGVFGLSTALALKERGFTNITVIDRQPPPVRDGSSNDISRIVRSDYTDPFYSRLATEAIKTWKSSSLFNSHYHHSGFLITSELTNDPFLEKNKSVLTGQSQTYKELKTTLAVRNTFPGLKDLAKPLSGYLNPNSGWADAAGAIKALASHLSEIGVSFITGPRGTLRSVMVDHKSKVVGVDVLAGPPIRAERVILATGAWTNRYLDLDYHLVGSAQPVGFIQLSPTEAKSIADIPVTINMTSGVFIFPPNRDNILKVAYHGNGFEIDVPCDRTEGKTISAPRRDSNNAASTYLPTDADAYLRAGLKSLVPTFADRPWSRGRLCWYTETPSGNFVADYHHSVEGLFIATGGSGHAFKFLPILGRYIADCFDGTATAEVQQKWKLPTPTAEKARIIVSDGSRRGPPRRLLNKAEQARL